MFASNWGWGGGSAGAAASATLSVGGPSTLKLGGCDSIVCRVFVLFFFPRLVRFDGSLSLQHRPAKRLKAAVAAFVVDACAPRSLTYLLPLTPLSAPAGREAHLSNLIHHLAGRVYNKQANGCVLEDQMASRRQRRARFQRGGGYRHPQLALSHQTVLLRGTSTII